MFRNLVAGDVVTVIVDSALGTGDFELDIDLIGEPCPSETLGLLDGTSGSIDEYTHSMSTSCGNVGETFGGAVSFFNAATFAWTSPMLPGTNGGCDIVYTGDFPASLSLTTGASCAGEELQCEAATVERGSMEYTATVSTGNIPPTDFTITLTQTAELLTPVYGSDFTLEFECFAT
ncbi:MAG: hypothetical protein AAGA54_32225 [Myxococcota bacterium]